jgi:hypothetical protein
MVTSLTEEKSDLTSQHRLAAVVVTEVVAVASAVAVVEIEVASEEASAVAEVDSEVTEVVSVEAVVASVAETEVVSVEAVVASEEAATLLDLLTRDSSFLLPTRALSFERTLVPTIPLITLSRLPKLPFKSDQYI